MSPWAGTREENANPGGGDLTPVGGGQERTLGGRSLPVGPSGIFFPAPASDPVTWGEISRQLDIYFFLLH